jgi:hypothetical protein
VRAVVFYQYHTHEQMSVYCDYLASLCLRGGFGSVDCCGGIIVNCVMGIVFKVTSSVFES